MDQLGLYDIYDTWYVPWWQQSWFKLSVATSAICLIVLFVAFIVYRYVKRPKLVTPAQRAVERITQLSQITFSGAEKQKESYLQLTCVLKEYLITRYSIVIKGMTDTELLNELKNHFDDQHQILKDIQWIFVESTDIKFAAAKTERNSFIQTCQRAIHIIQNTPPTQTREK